MLPSAISASRASSKRWKRVSLTATREARWRRNALQLTRFVDIHQPLLLDQVPGHILVDHRHALSAKASGLQHAHQTTVVRLQNHLHVVHLGQMFAQYERGTGWAVHRNGAASQVLCAMKHEAAGTACIHAVARGRQHAGEVEGAFAFRRADHGENAVHLTRLGQGQRAAPGQQLDRAVDTHPRADGFDDLDEGPGGPVVVSLMRGCVGEWREVFGDEAQLFGMAVADCQG